MIFFFSKLWFSIRNIMYVLDAKDSHQILMEQPLKHPKRRDINIFQKVASQSQIKQSIPKHLQNQPDLSTLINAGSINIAQTLPISCISKYGIMDIVVRLQKQQQILPRSDLNNMIQTMELFSRSNHQIRRGFKSFHYLIQGRKDISICAYVLLYIHAQLNPLLLFNKQIDQNQYFQLLLAPQENHQISITNSMSQRKMNVGKQSQRGKTGLNDALGLYQPEDYLIQRSPVQVNNNDGSKNSNQLVQNFVSTKEKSEQLSANRQESKKEGGPLQISEFQPMRKYSQESFKDVPLTSLKGSLIITHALNSTKKYTVNIGGITDATCENIIKALDLTQQ